MTIGGCAAQLSALPQHTQKRGRAAGTHWRGHLFLFNNRPKSTYGASTGRRLLLIFVVLEAVIGPRLALFRWLHITVPPAWVRIPSLLILALILVRFVARLELSQIGLAKWSKWSAIEKSYFVQVLLIANVVFIVMLPDHLRSAITEPAALKRLCAVALFERSGNLWMAGVLHGVGNAYMNG
jgi:hypothetical protein